MEKLSIKKRNNLILEDVPLLSQSKTLPQQEKFSFNEKLSLHSVQRHLSILKLEEILIMFSFITAGVLGRMLLQPFPSIEPITFIALLAGSLFGIRKGATVGASSWYLSNFFMFGGQGPWTLVHIGAGAFAGFLGGVMLRKPTILKSVIAIILSTIVFEIAINTMSGLLFYGIGISFITAIPFATTHLISNTIMSTLLPRSSTTIFKKGKLNEITMCNDFIKKLKQKRVETNEL